MSTTARKARKRAGIPFAKPAKTPTPALDRSHSWRQRWVVKKMRWEYRPSRIAIVRYGVRDLGWQAAGKYLTRAGKLTKAATA